MYEALRFFQEYESTIYLVLGIGVIVYGWRFWMAWQEMRGSIYGLEQINAQRRLNQSALALFLTFVMGFVVFSLVTFVSPVVAPEYVLPIDMPLLSPESASPLEMVESPSPEATEEEEIMATATPLPTIMVDTGGCIPGKIEITSPKPGEEIGGVVTIEGVVNVEDFSFYKFEYAPVAEEIWISIKAFRTQVPEEGPVFEDWDTSIYSPGSYVIQLVVFESDGDQYTPCRIPILIGNPP